MCTERIQVNYDKIREEWSTESALNAFIREGDEYLANGEEVVVESIEDREKYFAVIFLLTSEDSATNDTILWDLTDGEDLYTHIIIEN